MMANDWLTLIKNAKKSSIVQNNLKKVHFAFSDGRELVEEYNTDTCVVTRRAWKVKTDIGSEGRWDIEVGEPEHTFIGDEGQFIRENPSQPFVSRRITKRSLEWRIRNLPYPVETYTVTAEPENKCITVRTTNKKYFKRILVPDLERVGLTPLQENIDFMHKFNTLIINYKKPKEVMKMEEAIWEEVKNVEPQSVSDVNSCKPS